MLESVLRWPTKGAGVAEPQQRLKLVLAQQQWLKFRDVDCDYYELGRHHRAHRGRHLHAGPDRARAKELEGAVEP